MSLYIRSIDDEQFLTRLDCVAQGSTAARYSWIPDAGGTDGARDAQSFTVIIGSQIMDHAHMVIGTNIERIGMEIGAYKESTHYLLL